VVMAAQPPCPHSLDHAASCAGMNRAISFELEAEGFEVAQA